MKKRFLSLAMVLCMLLTTVTILPITANAASSGTCGDNLTWTLDNDGTLTISGTGDMYDYPWSKSSPWYNLSSSIKKVIVEIGVTSIGWRAFEDCSSLTSITIPDSVTSIYGWAFYFCTHLQHVFISKGVESIANEVFAGCFSLTDLVIDSQNAYYVYEDEILFSKDKTEILYSEIILFLPAS